MKKMIGIAFGIMLSTTAVANAELPDIIKSTLIDHVSVVTQFDSRGATRLAFMDSVIRIGSYEHDSILELQAGFTGEYDPDAGDIGSANFVAGGLFRVDPFIKQGVNFDEHWLFLKSIQHGPTCHYDFREKEFYFSYQAGLAFSLDPKEE